MEQKFWADLDAFLKDRPGIWDFLQDQIEMLFLTDNAIDNQFKLHTAVSFNYDAFRIYEIRLTGISDTDAEAFSCYASIVASDKNNLVLQRLEILNMHHV